MKKRTIYTSLDNLILKNNIIVKDYREMNDRAISWVEKHSETLLIKQTEYEKEVERILKERGEIYEKQVFFCITKKFYFLDFYLVDKKVAIEVDGKYHKNRRKDDSIRDRLFCDIGIRTIRIQNKDVLSFDYSCLTKGIHKRKEENNKVCKKPVDKWEKKIKMAEKIEREYFIKKYGRNYKDVMKQMFKQNK